MLKGMQPRLALHMQAIVHSFHIFRRKPFATFMTMLVLALALTLPALFLVLADNLNKMTTDWQRGGHISLYLKASVSEGSAKALEDKLALNPLVGELTYKSAQMGLDELTKLEGMQDIMRYLPENPLPAVIEIIPAGVAGSPDKLEQFYQELKAYPEVEQAKLDMNWVNRLHAIVSFLTKIAQTLLLLLALAVVLIISNTLRLTIQHRHEEIQVLKLIGAADAFIMRPFLYQGLWYGLGAALLAFIFINSFMICLKIVIDQLGSVYKINYPISGLTIRQILLLFIFAGILGWVGARLSVKRQLVSIQPY